MTKCDLSGDIVRFMNQEKSPDPGTYSRVKGQWEDAQKNGAIAAYTAFYADNSPHCATIKNNGSDIGAATYKLVVNFVIQFKDTASAAKGYSSETIFGFSAATLKTGVLPVIEGAKTGLSANSIVLNAPIGNQSIYIAVWQNKAFMVILAIFNLDPAASKKVATAENSRI